LPDKIFLAEDEVPPIVLLVELLSITIPIYWQTAGCEISFVFPSACKPIIFPAIVTDEVPAILTPLPATPATPEAPEITFPSPAAVPPTLLPVPAAVKQIPKSCEPLVKNVVPFDWQPI